MYCTIDRTLAVHHKILFLMIRKTRNALTVQELVTMIEHPKQTTTLPFKEPRVSRD